MSPQDRLAGLSDVFISYAHEDSEFADRLVAALIAHGRDPWIDTTGIEPADRFERSAFEGIDTSDAFVFVLTEDSLRSVPCKRELAHAVSLNKRLIVVGHEEPREGTEVPEELRPLSWIMMRPRRDDFAEGVGKVEKALDTDLELAQMHTKILVRARAWEAGGRRTSPLLRRDELADAEAWMTRTAAVRLPQPTELQREFLMASRRAATRRQRTIAGVSILVAVISIGLAAFAFEERSTALSNLKVAQSRQLAASAESTLNSDPELSTLLALKALELRHTTQAETALRDALPQLQILRRLTPHDPIAELAVSPDGSRFVALTGDSGPELCSSSGPRCLRQLSVPQDTNSITAVTFSPDGSEILGVDASGGVYRFNPATGASKLLPGFLSPTNVVITSIAYDGQGGRLATANSNGTATVWSPRGHSLRVVTEPHRAAVNGAALSPDGRRVLTASADGTARIWDVASGRLLAVMSETDHHPITTAEFSSDGRRVLTASSDGTARMWDAATGRQQLVLREPGGAAITAAHFSPDGSRAITASLDGHARIWDAANGRQLAVNTPVVLSPLSDALFLPGGHTAISSSHAGFATLWSTTTGRETASAPVSGQLLLGAAYSPDGRLIVTEGESGAQIWEAGTGRLVTAAGDPGDNVNSASFDPSDRRIVIVANTGAATPIQVWSVAGGRLLLTLRPPDPNAGTASAAFSLDGREIVTVETDGTADVWSAATGAVVRVLGRRGGSQMSSAVFTPDSTHVLTVTGNRASKWDVATGRLTSSVSGPAAGSSSSSDGVHVVTVAANGTVWVWDAASGRQVVRIVEPTGGAPSSESISRFGRFMATDGEDGVARLWSLATGRQVTAVNDPVGAFGYPFVALSPDATRLVTQSGSVWDASPRELIKTIPGASGPAALSHDGRYLLTFTNGGAQLWDAASGHLLHTLRPPQGVVMTAAAFSPDGSRVLTAGNDGVARVWSTASGAPEGKFAPPKRRALADAVFDPSGGTRVLTAGADGLARLWGTGGSGPLAVFGKDNTVPGFSKLPSFSKLPALRGVAFAPNGRYFVTYDVNGGITVYSVGDTAAPAVVLDTHGATPRFTSAGFDSRSDLVASATNGEAYVWYNVAGDQSKNGLVEPDRIISPGTGPLVSAAFSPNGADILTGGADGVARIWDSRTGTQMTAIKLGTPLISAAYANDGSEVVLSGGGRVTIWSAELARPLPALERIAHEWVTRGLTSSERATYLAGIGS